MTFAKRRDTFVTFYTWQNSMLHWKQRYKFWRVSKPPKPALVYRREARSSPLLDANSVITLITLNRIIAIKTRLCGCYSVLS